MAASLMILLEYDCTGTLGGPGENYSMKLRAQELFLEIRYGVADENPV